MTKLGQSALSQFGWAGVYLRRCGCYSFGAGMKVDLIACASFVDLYTRTEVSMSVISAISRLVGIQDFGRILSYPQPTKSSSVQMGLRILT